MCLLISFNNILFTSIYDMHHRYATKSLRFGKIDVARCPKLAETYGIETSVTTKTLPTMILFKDGVEYMRRPLKDSRNRTIPFSFSYVSVAFYNFCLRLNVEHLLTFVHFICTGKYCDSIQLVCLTDDKTGYLTLKLVL